MRVTLISSDSKYNLLRIYKGNLYHAHFIDSNTLSVINDTCINKRVEKKDFRICAED